MSSTFRKRQLVMYLFRLNVPALCYALLTQWMPGSIAVPDSLPGSSISTVYSRVSVVLLVAFVFFFLVFFTKTTVR